MTHASPKGSLEGLFRAIAQRPVGVSMAFVAGVVFGFISYQSLPLELMPDIQYPTVTVRTLYEGAAPQEVESQVSRPVEEALSTVEGLVQMESRSRPGVSDVKLGFDWGTDLSRASQSLREQLQVAPLPTTAGRPLILRYDPSLEPFVRIALSADQDQAVATEDSKVQRLLELRTFAEEQIERALEGVEGVAAVQVRGGFAREVRVEVREDWLAARQISTEAVENALRSQNINLAGGSVYEGEVEYLVRTINEFSSVQDLRELSIRRSDGVVVPLTDVATFEEGPADRRLVTHLDGQEAIEIEIYKEAGANVVEVAGRVKTLLFGDGRPEKWGGVEGLNERLPEGYQVTLLDDQAAFIESALSNLRSAAYVGGALAICVLFMFLRDVRATSIIGLSIPVSVVLGMAPLYMLGVSLNLMSLGGLALGVGMLVDNAVVVLESIHRFREEGHGRREASIRGVSHVALAVTASTLTTVAVFLPIQFVDGVAGELFGDLSLAVVSALVASLAVALFLVPTLSAVEGGIEDNQGETDFLGDADGGTRWSGSWKQRVWRPTLARARSSHGVWWKAPWRWMRWLLEVLLRTFGMFLFRVSLGSARASVRFGHLVTRWPRRALGRMAQGTHVGYQRTRATYEAGLRRLFVRPAFVLGTAVVVGAGAFGVGGLLGSELLPAMHQGRFVVDVALPVGTPLDSTVARISVYEEQLLSLRDVASVHARVGMDETSVRETQEGEHTARLTVTLSSSANAADEDARMEEVRRLFEASGDMKVSVQRPSFFSLSMPLEVYVFGFDLERLADIGGKVHDEMAKMDGLRDVQTSLAQGYPELRIVYDRERLHRLGIDPRTVAEQVRSKVEGVVATRLRRDDLRVPLRIQLAQSDRGTVDRLRRVNVNPSLVPTIPLDAVASIEEGYGPSEIRRLDQQRVVAIRAGMDGFDLGASTRDVGHRLEAMAFPEDMHWQIGGQAREMRASLASLWFAIGLAMFLVYAVMASTFEHLVHPFVILVSVPLAGVGAVVALAIGGSPVSVVVLLGAVVLVGVVVNNAIVLVDTIGRERREGEPVEAAVLRAGTLRLRPILITTATTVVGLAPLALGVGTGAEIQGPLAQTVVGGLLSSTFLTLGVVPVLYVVVERGLRRGPGALS